MGDGGAVPFGLGMQSAAYGIRCQKHTHFTMVYYQPSGDPKIDAGWKWADSCEGITPFPDLGAVTMCKNDPAKPHDCYRMHPTCERGQCYG